MDFDHTCSNCLQPYLWKDRGSLRRLPLLLSCGHTFCGACLSSLAHIRQHTRAINCPQCAVPTPFLPEQDPEQQLVPNLHILGVLTARRLHLRSVPVSSLTSKHTALPIIPVSPPPPETPDELCEECGYRNAEKRCLQCVGLYCRNCFELVHATSKSMRKHRSVPASEGLGVPEHCPVHTETLKHFCQLDEVPICSECSITGQHHGHDVISLASAADDYRQQLRQRLKEARDRLKGMIKTEKSLSKTLTQLSDESAARAREVHATFDQLLALLQCRKLTVLKELAEAASSYEEPVLEVHKALVKGIHSLTEGISTTQTAMTDNLVLVRNVKKCMTELSRPALPQFPQLNSRDPIRFNFDNSFKKQLLAVGSITSSALKWPQVTITNSTDEYQSDSSVERLLSTAPLRSPAPSCPPPTRSPSTRHARSCSPQPASREARPRAQLLPGKKGRGHSVSPTLHCTAVAIEDTAEVLVTHVESPSEFFVTFMKDSRKLAEVMEEVAQCCQPPRPIKRRNIKTGMVCAAQYEDEVWYRCCVEAVDLLDTTTFVTVNYTDYGNSEQVTLGRLSQLPEKLTAKPPLCQKGSLFGVEPPKRSQFAPLDWSHRATTLLKSVLKAHSPSPVRLKVYHEEPHLLQVDLLLTSASSLLSLREKLVSMGLATWSRRRAGQRAELRIAPSATPTTGGEIEVVVATAYSPSNFYVQTVSSEDTLCDLRATLDREFEQQTPAPIENPQNGMVCCAQYSDDAKWYRAEVIAVSGESVNVKYIDYGNTECVAMSGLATISRALLATPMQAIHCKLSDVEPLAGSQWSGRICDHFNALFDGNPVLRMTVCGQGSPMPVVLQDKKTAQSLSSMLVVQGLANLHRATPTHSHQGSQVSETVSEQVATPTATLTHGAPALQEEPLPKAAVEDRALPALQLPGEGEAVTCMVVQVTSPEDFHISLTSNEALSRIKPTDLAPRSWKPGQCGLAHFCGDSSWHRVKVEEVVSTTAQVLYLDYGNRDSIPVTGITAMPPSAWKVPPLAVRCSLVGVGPVGGAREWPHKACLFFSKQALEKTLVLTVKAPSPSTSHLPVSLALETGDDVACLLVASGYAEVMSWGKGHPEAMSSTSDLPTDLEQPPPPVGYLSPAPLTPREEVIVSVTFVSEGGVIHANLLQEGMLLPALTEQVQRTCHALPRMSSVAGIPPGHPCCSLFKEDGMFYRAKVETADTTTNSATVLYVDFGNTDTVEASHLVDTAVRMDIPVQAVAMKLANTEAVEWNAEQLQALWDITISDSEDFTAVIQPLHSPEGYPLVQLTSATGGNVNQRLKKVGVIPSGVDITEIKVDVVESISADDDCLSESVPASAETNITDKTSADILSAGVTNSEAPLLGTTDPLSEAPLLGTTDPLSEAPLLGTTDPNSEAPLLGTTDPLSEAPLLGTTDPNSEAPLLGTTDPLSEAPLLGTLIPPETVPLPKSPDDERLLTLPCDHDIQNQTDSQPDSSAVIPAGGGSVLEEDNDLDLD